MSFEFRAETLKRYNPLPYLLQLLLEVHGLRGAERGAVQRDGRVVFQCPGAWCPGPGLAASSAMLRVCRRYYRQRNDQPGEVDSGYVRVHVQVVPTHVGGLVTFAWKTAGRGFGRGSSAGTAAGRRSSVGSGLSLVRQLSSNVRWSDGGRSVCVEFCWGALA